MTKQKDHEQSSSSIYASMEPYDPVMSFEDYIKDDENIVDQVRHLSHLYFKQPVSHRFTQILLNWFWNLGFIEFQKLT